MSVCRTALQPRQCAAQLSACRTGPPPRNNAVALERGSGRSFATRAYHKCPKNIAVIGGGITGLSTAHYLAKYATQGTTITLYEADKRLGGWLKTQDVEMEYDGKKGTVRFERGPRTLRSYKKDTWKLDDFVLYDLLRDIKLEPIFRPGGTRYIAFGEELVALNAKNLLMHPKLRGIGMLVLTTLVRMKIRRQGKFDKIPYLPVGQRHDLRQHDDYDPSVAEFIKEATKGNPLADQLVSAVLHGVWGGDIDRLSMREVMPKFFWNFQFKESREHVHMPFWETPLFQAALADGEVVYMSRKSREGTLLMFADGMGALPAGIEKGLAANPAVTIKTGTRIKKLEYDAAAGKVMVSSGAGKPAAYDKVISTIYSKDLSSLMPNLPALAQAEAQTITSVNIWLPAPALNHPHRGLGYLLPRNDGGFNDSHGLLGVFFDSDIIIRPKDEPAGTKLFLLFRGAIPEEEAKTISREVLKTHLGIDPSIPAITLHSINENCIPQHNVGHKSRMADAHDELQAAFDGHLAVAGPSYTALGVVGSIRAGHDIAAQVTEGFQVAMGATGIARFLGPVAPGMVPVPRGGLIAMGRDIKESIPRLLHWLL